MIVLHCLTGCYHKLHCTDMQAASKPAEAPIRTQHLSREQIVKILEFLHKDDE